MRHLVCSVRCSVVPFNPSLLTVTLFWSVVTAYAYNDKIFSLLHDVIAEFDCMCMIGM